MIHRQYKKHLLQTSIIAGLACAAAIVGSGPAFAQDGAAPAQDNGTPASADVIQQIVVTAEFRKESVQNTPIAITAISGATLESRSQTNIVQAGNFAPGVTLTPAPDANGNSMGASIRGVGQIDFNPALEPGVGIYVDDVYFSQLTGSMLDLLDLDHVEVLRGPQGTLAGKNSIGGAIKLYSSPPTGENSATASLTYGSYNRLEGRGSGNFSIVPDKLFARVSLVSEHQDGYMKREDFACANPTLTYTDVNGVAHANVANPIPSSTTASNCVVGHQGGNSLNAGRIMLRWLATDSIEDNVIADISNENSEPSPSRLIALSDGGPGSLGALNSAYNGVPANSTSVPQLIPSDPYASYATFYLPGGSKGTSNGAPVTTSSFSAPIGNFLRTDGISNTLDWHLLDNLSLKSITAYRQFKSITSPGGLTPINLGLSVDTLKHWQVSQELRVSGDFFDKALEYTLGGFYFNQRTTYSTHQDLLSTSAVFNFLGNDPIDVTTKSLFVHAIWHITDKLEVAAGARYTDDRKTYTFHRTNGDTFGGAATLNAPPTAPVVCPILNPPFIPFPSYDCAPNFNYQVYGLDGASSTAKTGRTDWRGAVDYHWTPNFMTYFQFSTGFKGGGVDPRPFNIHQVVPFSPEKLKAYEVGVKSTWFDRLRLNTSVFYNDYTDVQVIIDECTAIAGVGYGFPCAMPTNGGNATVYGAELEGDLHLFDGLSIDGALSYIHFKYDTIDPSSGISLSATSPYTPEWKANLGVQYRFGLGNYGSVTPRVDVDYQDSMFGNATNTLGSRVASRTLANARLTWTSIDETLSAALAVTNLADKFYYTSKFDLLGSGGSGGITGQVAPPREVAFTIKKKF